jgi:hypothetical protein
MRTIRQGTFETNSSSSHSITIGGPIRLPFDLDSYRGKPFHVTGGNFGWEVETYHDPITKINYTAQDCGEGEIKDWLIELINEVYEPSEIIWDPRGYIDHQSAGTVSSEINSKEQLKEFIFGANSELTTDNDNH